MSVAATQSVAPLFPGALVVGNSGQFQRDPLGTLTAAARACGPIAQLRFFGWPAYLVTGPELVEEILGPRYREFKKSSTLFTPLLRGLFGDGLVTSEGEFWARQRRLAQPAFHREQIHSYGDTMVEYADRLASRWSGGGACNFLDEMMALTLAIAARTLFDAEVTEQTHRLGRVLERMMREFTRQWGLRGMVDYYFPILSRIQYRGLVRELDEIVYGVIAQRRASTGSHGDLLTLLMQLQDEDGSGMTDQQLRDETLTFLFAGHETTALNLAWTIYLLAGHRDAEEALAAEIRAVLGDRLPTVGDLPRLEYATWVVQESLRLYPPAWCLGREPHAELEVAGQRITPKSTVMIAPWVNHRDPAVWEAANLFRPERWANDREKRLPRGAYLPFGGGPRACIGKHFAIMEAVLVLVTLCRRFRFRLAVEGPIQPWATMTLRPKGGVPVRIEPR